ncbi:cyclic GMP-AMP synthase-like receptor isoform X2 [Macrosteles quadrilineatus]|uniref:cyclic GMP-AMP synthase-like receptor isoform X2 n=1 Tax=Macrosteles quadrilineatus TaxID=74068 RepID=UPI0023E1320E|nr:cyclic GMP-AMP synthase-like receptor isoform X2 [Macrosteles quadrilineatus]
MDECTDHDTTTDILLNSKYDMLNEMVEEIHTRSVRIPKDEIKIVNKYFQEVIHVFTKQMKEVDDTFKKIFRKILYTGSFFEGLKISSADEYDLNVIINPELKMKPVRKKKYAPAGHIAIEVIKDQNCEIKPYKDWLHHEKESNRYFLKIDQVKSWLQGIVIKARDKIVEEKLIKDFKLDIRQSGPAWTLIFKDQNRKVSIDLVPCLEFPNKDWPGIPRKPEKILNGKDNDPWFAVPKSPRIPPEDLKKNKLWFLAWRLSFPIQEKNIINDLNYLKFILRLLKQVRDQLKIHAVASYYIKTLFLWEIETQKDQTMWKKTSRGRLFMYMLIRFQEALEAGHIDFFWDKECNLVDHVAAEYLTINANQIKKFVKKVEGFIDKGDKDELRKFLRKSPQKRRKRNANRKLGENGQ